MTVEPVTTRRCDRALAHFDPVDRPATGPDPGDGRVPGPLDPSDVVDRLLAAPPSAGDVRVLAVDGPAGSGKKTTAARRLARDLGDAPLVHLDDLLEGWGPTWSTPRSPG
jgi:hypothetical protein